MKQTLMSNGLLNSEGKIQKTDSEMSFQEEKELSSVVQYLVANHGIESMQPVFDIDLVSELGSRATRMEAVSRSQRIMSLMDLEYINSWENEDGQDEKVINYNSESRMEIDITGYSFFISDFNYNTYSGMIAEDSEWIIEYDNSVDQLNIKNIQTDKSINTGLNKYVNSLIEDVGNFSQPLIAEELIFEYSNGQLKVKVLFNNLNIDSFKENKINSFKADIFIVEI
jgi:hypothetical protein